MRPISKFMAFLFICAAAVLAHAQGGPPMRTDDPGTPDNGNFEVNVAVTSDRHFDERELQAPDIDFNYGLGERIQLNFEIPFIIHGTNGNPTQSGLGNSSVAVKWRYFESKKHALDLSIYPRLNFNNPTSSARRGLVDQGVRMLFPFEVTKTVGPVEVNGEVGYAIDQTGPNDWIAGLAIGRSVTPRLELMGEFYAASRTDASDHETTLDAGARYKLSKHFVLLLMAGRSVRPLDHGEPGFVGYGGMQFLFSRKKHPEPEISH